MKTKVAYLFDTFPSPSETFLAREISALRGLGLDIEVWALRAGAGAKTISQSGRIFKRLRRHAFWRQVGRDLGLQLRAAGVTHIHGAWANHVADIAMFAAQSAGLPWSFAAHARDIWVEGGDLKTKLASARFATACTHAGVARLREFGSDGLAAKVFYMAHGIEIENYPWHIWHASPEKKLLGVGRLVPKKGWQEAIAATAQLVSQGHRAQLTIIGDGPLRAHFEREAAHYPWLTLRGALPHDKVIAAMQAANCFVLPSVVAPDGDRDGLANVLLEAAALGLPLVTTKSGSARDLVDEETGWLTESNTPQMLAATVERVWAAPAETVRRASVARRRIEHDFDAQKNVQTLLERFQAQALPSHLHE